jgi:hypothetical protein
VRRNRPAAEHLAPRSARQARGVGTIDDPGWLKSRFARRSAARPRPAPERVWAKLARAPPCLPPLGCCPPAVDGAKEPWVELMVQPGEWRYRLGVRTRGSQPRDRGSNPRTATITTGGLLPFATGPVRLRGAVSILGPAGPVKPVGQVGRAPEGPCVHAAVSFAYTSLAMAVSWKPTPVRSATVICDTLVRPALRPATTSPSWPCT